MLCVTVSVISDILHQYVITSIQSYVKHEKWCLCHDWRHRSPFLFDILYIFICKSSSSQLEYYMHTLSDYPF